MRYLVKGLGLAALVATMAGGAGAQQAGTTPWRAFYGCWSAGGVTPLGADASLPIVCVVPTANSSVAQITTIADGKVISTQSVDASGRDVPLDAKDCAGTQNAHWSADGRRVYLNATATCDGVSRTTSGILAMTPGGEWLDVQGVRAGGEESVRVARYRDIGMRNSVPADIADALRNMSMSVQSARAIAGAPIGTTGVVEASHATSVAVAEAFVLERGQMFSLDAGQLVALADAGVSPRLTDAMIAVSNPQTFAVNRPEPAVRDVDDASGRRTYVMLDRYSSPWGWGYGPYGYSRYGYGYDPYGYNSYGSYYGGYGYPGYIYSGGPVVIVRGTADQAHGRMVKGRGYQQGSNGSASSSSSAARESARESSRSSGSSSSGSSTPASSSGSSSSGSTEQRTAKPRP